MTASTAAVPQAAASAVLIRRYYAAMAVPYAIDVATLIAYGLINDAMDVLPSSLVMSTLFLVGGVGLGAHFLIRPIRRFMAGETTYAEAERSLTSLPRRSAAVMALCYTPMLALRLLARRFEIDFGALAEETTRIDDVTSFVVQSGFNVLLTFYMVSAYLDGLCEHLFEAYGVNLSLFMGRFRRKVGVAVLFLAFAAMVLLLGDIASYSGPRLAREVTMDVVTAVLGTFFIFFWIRQALTRPIARLDHGMRQVAQNDFSVRLPVTSDDEMGHAVAHFNKMVEGLSEREYLRDTFGKYVNESVAAAILQNRHRTGRVDDRIGEATLMFTDIQGFTGLAERMGPAEIARLLNAYLAAVVPVIQRHHGVVNNFIGDGLFASFNMPLPNDKHAAAALRAALEIQQALDASPDFAKLHLRTRIGLNTGTVIGVTIGTENRLNYTLLGDAVNVASRIEQLNKEFGTRVLAAESTVRAAAAFETCQRLGETDIRGHEGDIVVYRVGPP